MAKNIYIIENTFLRDKNPSSENAALTIPMVFDSYIKARRAIQGFTKNWKVQPTLVRRVTPKSVVRTINQRIAPFNSVALATWYSEIQIKDTIFPTWFAIY